MNAIPSLRLTLAGGEPANPDGRKAATLNRAKDLFRIQTIILLALHLVAACCRYRDCNAAYRSGSL